MAQIERYRPPMNLEGLAILERETGLRHELVNGIAYGVALGSKSHSGIIKSAGQCFRKRIEKNLNIFERVERLFSVDGKSTDVFYPDIMVTSETPGAKSYRQPIVIVEVLSRHSNVVDRGSKRVLYQDIPSLEHYLIVSQNHVAVESIERRNEWTSVLHGSDDEIEIPSLGVSIPVDEFYAQTSLAKRAA